MMSLLHCNALRRRFLTGLALGSLPVSVTADVPVDIACLSSPPPDSSMLSALRIALVHIDPTLAKRARFTEDFAHFDPARLRQLAHDLNQRRPALIVCFDFDAASAAVATRSAAPVPIVFRAHDDPLARGLIDSYARPGRNLTGITTYRCIDDKLVQLMTDALPSARRIGFIHDASAQDGGCNELAHRFAQKRGVQLLNYSVAAPEEVPSLLARLGKRRPDAMVVGATASTWRMRKEIIARLDALAIPAIYEGMVFVDDGGLMQFSAMPDDSVERMAKAVAYVAQHGVASDFPVSQPLRFELVVNLKARHATRYGLSPQILRRADQILE